MRRILAFLIASASVFVAQNARQNPAAMGQKRPFTFADMMALKRIGDPQVSPDGRWIMFSAVDVSLTFSLFPPLEATQSRLRAAKPARIADVFRPMERVFRTHQALLAARKYGLKASIALPERHLGRRVSLLRCPQRLMERFGRAMASTFCSSLRCIPTAKMTLVTRFVTKKMLNPR